MKENIFKSFHNHRYSWVIFSIVLLLFIGIIDWQTGYEATVLIFYIIPFAVIAFYGNASKITLFIFSLFAASIWLLADILSNHPYTSFYIPYWNAFVRLLVFLTISQLFFLLQKKQMKMQEINKELQEINKEKNLLIGIAAHDLRNHIGNIYSYSELLLSDKDSVYSSWDKKEIYEVIHDSSKDTLDLLSNLLDVSKIESGTINLNIKRLNYFEFIESCMKTTQLLADKKNIRIHFQPECKDQAIDFDPLYLEEVINNLLTNAIKFSYNNSMIEIRVSLNNSNILTEVIDNGVGIPDQEINRLFNPFQRASSKPTADESSTGLGLAIVKKIITLHNGTVGIKSTLNKGSNFYFYLPLKT